MPTKKICVVDLFCGAGGTSTGLLRAASRIDRRIDLTAIDHWPVAIETHSSNHPSARHLCQSIDPVDAHCVVRGDLDLLIASPECTHFSRARGGRPRCDQSRASAWHVVRWATDLRPRWILVENVMEFLDWGPLGVDGRPLKSQKGVTFRAWVEAIRGLHYTVEWRVLNAVDYGGATSRRRLFVLARRGRYRRLRWPEPTHAPEEQMRLFSLRRWRAAREIIDWSLSGESIFRRRRPLAETTMHRIEEGLRRYRAGGLIEPFLLTLTHGGRTRSLHAPVPTITCANEHALIEPFLVSYYGTGRAHSVRDPLPTVTTRDRFGLINGSIADIRFRMLQPHELAAAMGFPAGYHFTGNKTEKVCQIGNAVQVDMAEALFSAILEAA